MFQVKDGIRKNLALNRMNHVASGHFSFHRALLCNDLFEPLHGPVGPGVSRIVVKPVTLFRCTFGNTPLVGRNANGAKNGAYAADCLDPRRCVVAKLHWACKRDKAKRRNKAGENRQEIERYPSPLNSFLHFRVSSLGFDGGSIRIHAAALGGI